jgi:zinc protease
MTLMRIKSSLLALGLVFATTAPAVAQRQTPPEPGTPRAFSVPAARQFSLPNGLQVTLVPYGEIPKVTVRLITRAGNVNEGPTEVWLADLMADLMQEGTTTRSAQEIAAEAARMGGSVFVGVGANTTVIAGDVLSEFAPGMVALVADLAQNPSFPASELPRLQANRSRQLSIARSQPQPLAQERFRQVLYPDHPYGRLYPTPEMIQGYTVQQVREFYDHNFGAERSHL